MLRASALTVSPLRVRRDGLPRLLDWQREASDHKDDMVAVVPERKRTRSVGAAERVASSWMRQSVSVPARCSSLALAGLDLRRLVSCGSDRAVRVDCRDRLVRQLRRELRRDGMAKADIG